MGTVTTAAADRTVAGMHHAAVAASAISAAWELGALDELHESGVLDAEEFAQRLGLDVQATRSLFRALAVVDVVHRDGTRVTPGGNFAEVYRTRSFFHWLARGSADLFRRLPELLHQRNRCGDFARRDGAAIAFACQEMNTLCYDPWFWRAVDGLDFDVAAVADLGCGSGQRVIELLERYPGARGIGIDLDPPALELARAGARRAGQQRRAAFLAADVTRLDQGRADFAEVDLLTCFMMGHDFWPRPQCLATLQRLRRAFPGVRRFLLGDATRGTAVADRDLPIFSVAFELAHDVMGKYIPTVPEWEAAFSQSGWRVRRTHLINLAVNEVLFELEPS